MKKSKFLTDFKAFISKGNVIDMAVGVVIGGSFGKIVTGLVNYIINPFVGLFIKNGSLDSFKTVITPAHETAEGEAIKEVAILWGTWIQTIIDFLITALCIFVVLRVVMKLKNKAEAKKIAEAEAKAAADKEAADKAAAEESEKVKALAERQKLIEDSVLNQEKLLAEISAKLNK